MSDEELKKAVEIIKARQSRKEEQGQAIEWNALRILLDLADRYLSVDGLPEKNEYPVMYPDTRAFRNGKLFGFDEALDLCRISVAKNYCKIPEEAVIENIIFHEARKESLNGVSIEKHLAKAIISMLRGEK